MQNEITRKFKAAIEGAKDHGGALCEKAAPKLSRKSWGLVPVLAAATLTVPFGYDSLVLDDQPLEEKRLIQTDKAYAEATSALERLAQKKQADLDRSSALITAHAKGDLKEMAALNAKAADAGFEQDRKLLFGKMFLDGGVSEKEFIQLAKSYNDISNANWDVQGKLLKKLPNSNSHTEGAEQVQRNIAVSREAVAFKNECIAQHPVDQKLDLISNVRIVSYCMRHKEKGRDLKQFFGGALGVILGGTAAIGMGIGLAAGAGSGAELSRRRREEKDQLRRSRPDKFGHN